MKVDSRFAARADSATTHRCPSGTSASFVWRKLPAAPPKALLMAAPDSDAPDAVMDEWLCSYRAALDKVDADDGSEPGTPLPMADAWFSSQRVSGA